MRIVYAKPMCAHIFDILDISKIYIYRYTQQKFGQKSRTYERTL